MHVYRYDRAKSMSDDEIVAALVTELQNLFNQCAAEVNLDPSECVGIHFGPAREILDIARKRFADVLVANTIPQ